MISAIDEATDTCTVYWHESGHVHDCSIGRRGVLCKPSGDIPGSLGGDDGLASVGMARSAAEAMRKLFGGQCAKGQQTTTPVEPFALQAWPFARQISYEQYAEKAQTAIIFAWDDTLFPSTYVKDDLAQTIWASRGRGPDHLGLSLEQRLKDQKLKPQTLSRVRTALAKAAGAADQLLRLADERGKVIIVTLAKSPWVTDSCRLFFPGIGELIKQLNIQIVYAQEGEQIEHNKVNMMTKDQSQTFWAETMGRAISKALSEFYSQYKGQSWKNIISLGASHLERYGTMAATMQYAEDQGVISTEEAEVWRRLAAGALRGSVGSQLSVSSVKRHDYAGQRMRTSWEGAVNGREMKVRTKTLEMLEGPTVEELIVELSLLHGWLPLMVGLDAGFDADFNSLDGEADIDKIESALRAPGC